MPSPPAHAPFLTRLRICEDGTLRPCSDAFSPSCYSGRPCSPALPRRSPAARWVNRCCLPAAAAAPSITARCLRKFARCCCMKTTAPRASARNLSSAPTANTLSVPRIYRRSPPALPQPTRHSRCMSSRPPHRLSASAGSLLIALAKNAALPPPSSPSTRTRRITPPALQQ
jgi:hypothetical protein